MKRVFVALLFLIALGAPVLCAAHEVRPCYLEITEAADHSMLNHAAGLQQKLFRMVEEFHVLQAVDNLRQDSLEDLVSFFPLAL